MTPVNAGVVYPSSRGCETKVVRDDAAQALFPDIVPVGYDTAVRRALANLELGQVETRWSDSLTSVSEMRPLWNSRPKKACRLSAANR